MKVVASALSDRGLKRDGNEDQYLIDEALGLYVVCDGMGGHAAGEVAAETAIEFASEHISANADALESAGDRPDGYFRVLKIAEEAVQAASQEIYHMSKSSAEDAGMGTTMTMLMIVDNKAIMAHVGDSRMYLKRGGEIHQLTVDHTLANEPSRVLLVDRKKFNKLTRRMPRMGNALLRNLSRHLSQIIVASEAPRPIDLDDTGPLA